MAKDKLKPSPVAEASGQSYDLNPATRPEKRPDVPTAGFSPDRAASLRVNLFRAGMRRRRPK